MMITKLLQALHFQRFSFWVDSFMKKQIDPFLSKDLCKVMKDNIGKEKIKICLLHSFKIQESLCALL